MRYLRGTSKLKLTFRSGKPILVGYTDSDMAGDVDNRRSTSGYLMTFSGGVVSWQSRLQKRVALSITETEYIVVAEACKELLWMKRFIHELRFKQQCYMVYCDNQSAIHLSKNSTFHARSKHIDVRYHWMRDALNDNLFELEKIHTDHNDSDMLTKSLPREKLEISSKVRSRFVCGPIDLKFGREVRDSLIFNLNDGDQIWSFGRSSFNPRTKPLFWFSQEGIKSGCALFVFIPSSLSSKVVSITNPGNPTGTCIPDPLLKRISEICRRAGTWLVVDNAYEYFTYGGLKHSCVEGNHVVNLFSFSKAYGMMGWRVGYIAYPSEAQSLRTQLLKVQDNVAICASMISQSTALGCLEAGREWVRNQVKSLVRNRELLLEALSPIGQDAVKGGGGAIYIWAKLPEKYQDDFAVVCWLAKRHGVVLLPGSACGLAGCVRVTYGAIREAECEVAAKRLRAGLEELMRMAWWSDSTHHVTENGWFFWS
ncbi:Aromatic aminotransferase ISS1 [Vitis vinifera]|uniref:Aromatic aminotransferase ISS1 n=1 Tax=Vitis vinifera TaxID=29760 RepID=A0A438KEW5_VITVI|nr:Aromatic aminotransferase ISS1 [Vitis vinifera]